MNDGMNDGTNDGKRGDGDASPTATRRKWASWSCWIRWMSMSFWAGIRPGYYLDLGHSLVLGTWLFFFAFLCGKMTDVDATRWTVDSVVDLPHEEEMFRMFVLILFKIICDSVVGRFSLVARRLDCTTFAADWPQQGRTKPDGRVRVQ